MKNSRLKVAMSSYTESEPVFGFEGIQADSSELYMANGAASRRSTEPYKMRIENGNANNTQKAVLFGYNRFAGAHNFGSEADIKITTGIPGVPYSELLRQSATQPFEVVKMRVASTNIAQLDNSFVLTVADSNGDAQTTQIDTTSYLSPNQFQNNIRDIDRNFSVDGSTFLTYEVAALAVVNISFYISAKVNVVRPLLGRGAVDEYSAVRVRSFK